jgi:RNA polymerase sigma factor (sigma-70 family)
MAAGTKEIARAAASVRQMRSATLEGIEDVYRRRLDELVRVAAAIVGDRERARDAVHDAFARAVRKRQSYRGEGGVESWLWRFVVRAAQDEARRRRGEVLFEVDTRGNGYEPNEHARVQRIVAQLPERQRAVLFLRYYADLDYSAIAEALGISAGTVGATLHAAHAALRQRLEEAS